MQALSINLRTKAMSVSSKTVATSLVKKSPICRTQKIQYRIFQFYTNHPSLLQPNRAYPLHHKKFTSSVNKIDVQVLEDVLSEEQLEKAQTKAHQISTLFYGGPGSIKVIFRDLDRSYFFSDKNHELVKEQSPFRYDIEDMTALRDALISMLSHLGKELKLSGEHKLFVTCFFTLNPSNTYLNQHWHYDGKTAYTMLMELHNDYVESDDCGSALKVAQNDSEGPFKAYMYEGQKLNPIESSIRSIQYPKR
ncbi:hypothetical protein SCG7109_BI_00040, partial [Chlamydiales bacterium SCGC AG-110-M15]